MVEPKKWQNECFMSIEFIVSWRFHCGFMGITNLYIYGIFKRNLVALRAFTPEYLNQGYTHILVL
jgi:hypothetical protein